MTLKFIFLTTSKEWAVVGPEDEVKIGPVSLLNKQGVLKHENIVKLLPVFDTPEGPMRYGILATLPKHRQKPIEIPQRFPVEVRMKEE